MSRRALLAAALGAQLAGCEKPPRRAGGRLLEGLASADFGHQDRGGANPFAFDPQLFERKTPPEPGDWLAAHTEAYQSYDAYVARDPIRPTSKRRRIVLLPLGPLSKEGQELLGAVRDHATAFFSLPVDVAPGIPLPKGRRRLRKDGVVPWQQYHAGTILEALEDRVPDHAVALLGITQADLYPEQSWNFVFGQATLTERVGTYSIARFMPPFEDLGTPDEFGQALRRSVKLLAHETGHVFSIPHCVRFECVMNGSNSLAETDRKPVDLCPDCLRKLAYATGFDPVERYQALHRFFATRGLDADAGWFVRRLARLTHP